MAIGAADHTFFDFKQQAVFGDAQCCQPRYIAALVSPHMIELQNHGIRLVAVDARMISQMTLHNAPVPCTIACNICSSPLRVMRAAPRIIVAIKLFLKAVLAARVPPIIFLGAVKEVGEGFRRITSRATLYLSMITYERAGSMVHSLLIALANGQIQEIDLRY